MPAPAILKDIGGTLIFPVPEGGAVTGTPTCKLYDTNKDLLAEPVVTVTTDPSQLSVTVTAGNAAALGANYRALWQYVIGTETYRRNQTFDVTMAKLYPPITTPAQLFQFYPLLETRDFQGTSKIASMAPLAWEKLVQELEARGKFPNLLIDPAPLKPVLAALWASMVAKNYRPGGWDANEWQGWARARAVEADKRLNEVLANLRWYDSNEDLKPDADEVNVPGNLLMISG